MLSSVQAIVLAAGKSTRFQTSLTKLSFTICGQEMIMYPLRLLADLGIKTTVVVGYQKDIVLEIIHKHAYPIDYVEQTTQKGTGHAVLCTQDLWTEDTILILNGDAPLLQKDHLQALMEQHAKNKATISFIAAYNADPSITGYGRVITHQKKISIVEQRDFTGDPAQECRLNAGVYLINRSFLSKVLPSLAQHASGEIFITDLIKKASELNEHIEVVDVPFDFVRGINTLKELWIAEHIKKSELISAWMMKGVRFMAPQSVHIDVDVTIGADTTIGYGVQLRNNTRIGHNVLIDAFSIIDNAVIHDEVLIHSHSVVSNSEIHSASAVGPFARVHRESILSPQSAVGNFVEVSKSTIGKKSKAKHLAYLGNAQIGAQVNIGAGTITCNYDGAQKHTTVIEDNVFIGSNSSLIAPVTIAEGALVAAGSVITKDVPAQALAIARERQVVKEHYAPILRNKIAAKKNTPSHETILEK